VAPSEGIEQSMSSMIGIARAAGFACRVSRVHRALWACAVALVCAVSFTAAPTPAAAADPAVKFMAQVGRELMAAARTRSPGVMANVINRYGDVSYIGLYSLGSYRNLLSGDDRATYYSGMVRFIARYSASEAPKYPVAKVEWSDQSFKASNGIMVDSTVTLESGSVYEIRWLLVKYGNTFKVRDAMVAGFWMTPFLKQLFEDYIANNGGHPRALVAALNR
jgi:phospholipid transport system substrate-binding protein